MPEKVLFVSNTSGDDFSLALYEEKTVVKLSGVKSVNDLYECLSSENITNIGIYKTHEEQKIMALANELMIPVISVTALIQNEFATDLLPVDMEDINKTSAYVGIYDESSNKAYLTAQIYKQIMIQKHITNNAYGNFTKKMKAHN